MKIHISFLCRVVTTLIIVICSTISLFCLFGNRLKNHYLNVASLQSNKIASLICLNSVSTLQEEKYSQVEFINNDEFNTNELNLFIKDSVNKIYQEIRKVENGESSYLENKYGKGIIYEIPFNLFSDNVLFSSFGPKIPVKYNLISDIKGQLVSHVEEFGINNALISLNVEIDYSSRVTVPLSSDIVITKIEVPLYTKIFTGEIPSIYPFLKDVSVYYSTEEVI